MYNNDSYIIPVYRDEKGSIHMQPTNYSEERPESLRKAFQRMLSDCEKNGIIVKYDLYYDRVRREGFSKEMFLAICSRGLKISEEEALKKYFIKPEIKKEELNR